MSEIQTFEHNCSVFGHFFVSENETERSVFGQHPKSKQLHSNFGQKFLSKNGMSIRPNGTERLVFVYKPNCLKSERNRSDFGIF